MDGYGTAGRDGKHEEKFRTLIFGGGLRQCL